MHHRSKVNRRWSSRRWPSRRPDARHLSRARPDGGASPRRIARRCAQARLAGGGAGRNLGQTAHRRQRGADSAPPAGTVKKGPARFSRLAIQARSGHCRCGDRRSAGARPPAGRWRTAPRRSAAAALRLVEAQLAGAARQDGQPLDPVDHPADDRDIAVERARRMADHRIDLGPAAGYPAPGRAPPRPWRSNAAPIAARRCPPAASLRGYSPPIRHRDRAATAAPPRVSRALAGWSYSAGGGVTRPAGSGFFSVASPHCAT